VNFIETRELSNLIFILFRSSVFTFLTTGKIDLQKALDEKIDNNLETRIFRWIMGLLFKMAAQRKIWAKNSSAAKNFDQKSPRSEKF
jgi:hypothetical protein